ncbi:MAG: methyl-accepting chemotaxis protein, partial [Phycisphaerales bacterium]
MQPRRSFRHSLLGRMVLVGILPAAAVFGFTVAFSGNRAFMQLEEDRTMLLLEAADAASMRIDAQNARLVAIGRTVADAAAGGLFGKRLESVAFLREVLASNPQIAGLCYGYEPNADGQDAAWVGDARLEGAIDGTGRFIPYWKRDPAMPDRLSVELLVDIDDPNTEWYVEPKRLAESGRREAYVTAPYDYVGVQMVSMMGQLFIEGEFKGVVGIDFSLESVDAVLMDAVSKVDADAFLLSRGVFVAATTDERIAATRREAEGLQIRAAADTPFAALFAKFERDRRESFTAIEVDPVLGETCYYAVTRVPTGDWLMVVRLPRSTLLAPVFAMATSNALVAGAGLAILIGLLVRMSSSLSRRIGATLGSVERIAAGDLATRVQAGDDRDEAGDLSRGVGAMGERLRELVGRVRESTVRLQTTSDEVAAGGRDQAAAAATFGSSVVEIAAASRQIAATAEELRSMMEAVDGAASDTASMADEGRRDLQSMEDSMRSLEQGTSSVSSRLAAIDEKATGIGAVVTTITKVADQTNLLSVNAALEAEKAGQFGVGFMVVAREIRRLADQTAEATLDIERMVRQMQEAVAAGVGEMKRFDERVRSGVAEASRLASQMSRMIERVNEGSGQVSQVREGMQSQAQGAMQITQSISSLEQGATSVGASAKEFSDAAVDLQRALRTLRDAVEMFRVDGDE